MVAHLEGAIETKIIAEFNLYGCSLGEKGGLGEQLKGMWGTKTTASDTKMDYDPIGKGIWKPSGHYQEMK